MLKTLRLPTSWKDGRLLEDPPFSEEFLRQKFLCERRNRSDKWIQRLAKLIRDTPELRATAVAWAGFAFEPEGKTQRKTKTIDHGSLETVEVFVKFYWAWYAHGEQSAQQVVNNERKNRGFGWRLPNIQQDPGPPSSPQSHGVATAEESTEEPRLPTLGIRVRPQAGGLGIADATVTAETVTDDGIVAGPKPFANRSEHEGKLLNVTEDEKDDMIVFGEEHDVDAYLEAHSCSELVPLQVAVTPEEATSAFCGRRGPCSPTVVEAPSSADISTVLEDSDLPARLNNKEPHTTSSFERPQSSPTMGESAHHKKSKRRRSVTKPDIHPHVDNDTSSLTDIGRRSHKKRSKQRTSSSVPTPTVRKTHRSSLPSASTPPSLQNPTGKSAKVRKGAKARGKASKKAKRSHAGKMSGADAGALNANAVPRASKRQRAEDGHNAIHVLNEATLAQRVQRMDPRASEVHDGQLEQGGLSGSSQRSATHDRTARATMSRKRAFGEEVPPGAAELRPVPIAERKVAKLPKPPKSGRKRVDVAPRPSPTSLGIPANLAEADRMMCAVAAEALMTLQNPMQPAEEWSTEGRPQDEIPPSDDDDEEETPLREIVSRRPQVSDHATVVSASQGNFDCVAQAGYEVSCTSRVSGLPPAPAGLVDRAPVPKPSPPNALPKRPLTVQPGIWAKSRQEVCESLDWFRSYQGGVYSKNEIVKGYLLGAFFASRDLFARNGRLIISHGGGKAESVHNQKGVAKVVEASDQHEGDKSVRALLRTCLMKRPVALIIDDRYALFPYDLASKEDCAYAALGFYHIAYAWAERQRADNGKGWVVRYKFAFEWCEKQPAPWWEHQDACDGTSKADDTHTRPRAQYHRCPACSNISPLVYQEGWMCLQADCSAFWTLPNGMTPPEDLTYTDSFLNASFRCDHEILEDIAPLPPATEATDGVVTSCRFAKGWHCKKCGRLSCRFKWQHWECQSCGNTMSVSGKNRIAKEFWSQSDKKFMHHQVLDPAIKVSRLMPYNTPGTTAVGHYHVYVLPENRGRLYLITSNKVLNRRADDIFEEYQEQAKTGELELRRFPLKSHQTRGELLTNYFSQNSGEPYQYIGGTANTIPFDAAPSAVVKARDLIHTRMMSVMLAESTNPYQFNEVLSAAYMEEQSMSFHSDAEEGLGPRVASLSLGSSAYMHFRLHKKYRTDGGTGNVRNSLTLFLRHGDVLIMDGAAIQEYYEHTVVPLNFRIAATARYIGGRTH